MPAGPHSRQTPEPTLSSAWTWVDVRHLAIPRAGAIAIALLAWSLIGLPTTLASAQSSKPTEGTVTEVRIEGHRSIPESDIRARLKTRAGRPYDSRILGEDIAALYKSGWFNRVQAYQAPDPSRPDGLVITFRVAELPVLRSVEFRGLTKLKLKEVEESTGLKAGEPANFVDARLATRQIERLYSDKGYEWARVRLLEGGEPNDTRVVYEIFEGPKCKLRSLNFVGNTWASDSILRTKVTSKPAILGVGGTYRADELDADRRSLKEYYLGQGFFEVDIRPVVRRDPGMGNVDVEWVVAEGTRYVVREIEFDGNQQIPEVELREGLVMHSGKPFSDDLREADRKNLQSKYGQIGCIDARVEIERRFADPTNAPGVVDLVYHVVEGPQFRVGRLLIEGNDRTLDDVIRREANMAGLVPGEPIDADRLEKFKQRVGSLNYFATTPDKGNPIEVRLTNRRGSDKPYGTIVDVDLERIIQTRLQSPELLDEPLPALPPISAPLAPGPGPAGVAPLAPDPGFDFAPPVDAPVVAPSLAPAPPGLLLPGEPLFPARPVNPPSPPGTIPNPPLGADVPPGVLPSIPGLNMTDPGPDRQEPFPQRSFADIITSVDEVGTGRFMVGVGASSFGGLSGTVILHETNFDPFNIPRSPADLFSGRAFRGRGHDLRIELSPGTAINRALISYRIPYLFNRPVSLGLQGYTFRRFYPDWTEDRTGGKVTLGRQFGTQTYADLGVRLEDVNMHGFKSPAPAEFLAYSGHNTLFSIRPTIRFDNRNDPTSPVSGRYLEFAFEQYFNAFNAPKFTVEGRQHFTTGSRADGSGKRVLTLRGYYGITGRDTAPYERFFAGDYRSLRGFAYRGVGPHVLGQKRRRPPDGARLGRIPVPLDRQRQAPASLLHRLRHRRQRLLVQQVPARHWHRVADLPPPANLRPAPLGLRPLVPDRQARRRPDPQLHLLHRCVLVRLSCGSSPRSRTTDRSISIRHQAFNLDVFELLPPFQERQFDDEGAPHDDGPGPPDQVEAGPHRAAGRQHVVEQQDLPPGLDGVGVHLQGVGPVFQVIGGGDPVERQFARLTDRHEPRPERQGQRRRE